MNDTWWTVPSDSSTYANVTITPPDPNILAIIRLYLEHYAELDIADRLMFRTIIKALALPLTTV